MNLIVKTAGFYLVHIHSILTFCSVIKVGAIPCLIEACAMINFTTPTVKNPHVKILYIHSEGFKLVIYVISVWCKGIRNKQGKYAIYTDNTVCSINTSCRTDRYQLNCVSTRIRIQMRGAE